LSKLYREGSFGVITKSGGLSNEIIWICSQFADGITTAIGIGGDAYPGTDYVSYLEMFENDLQTKAVVIVGEMGGDLEERAAEWYGAKKRRVKLIGVVSGFCQESLPKGMKFGHAGAKEGMKGEGSARSKSEALKKAEKPGTSILDGVPATLPALAASQSIQGRARRIGFDWPDVDGPLAKLVEEVEEFARAGSVDEREDEFGDILFVLANIGQRMGVDAEQALRGANEKFRRRFRTVEELAAGRGVDLKDLDLAGLDALWDEAKAANAP
ncbi:hypothetical protein EDM76_13545, partial [bacterium]